MSLNMIRETDISHIVIGTNYGANCIRLGVNVLTNDPWSPWVFIRFYTYKIKKTNDYKSFLK